MSPLPVHTRSSEASILGAGPAGGRMLTDQFQGVTTTRPLSPPTRSNSPRGIRGRSGGPPVLSGASAVAGDFFSAGSSGLGVCADSFFSGGGGSFFSAGGGSFFSAGGGSFFSAGGGS